MSFARSRRSCVVLAILVGLALAAPGAGAAQRIALAPGDAAPDMRGNRSDETFVRPDYTANKLTVINFWATWCEPCRDEMPALQWLHETHGTKGLSLIGVLHDNVSLSEMQKFADDLGVTYTVIRPRKGVTSHWGGVGVLPTTFVIDSGGMVVRRYVGATAEQIKGLVADIEALLGGKPLGPMIIPETPSVATEEDRQRALKEQQKD